jgi:integrase
VLKTAIRHGWLAHLPDLSPPYRTQGKIVHRPWFSPEEYKRLYEATRDYASHPLSEHFRWDAEQLHDFVLFMGNTGLRPDEAKNLQFRDVSIVTDDATRQKILEIDVRGKRGVGYCKSLPGAVRPFERLLARAKPSRTAQTPRARRIRGEAGEAPPVEVRLPEPTDHLFPSNYTKSFNRLLERTKLKFDRDNKPRAAYSLRHTYICMRLMEGADIYQIAKNCRTSVEMIEKFYAAHIKNTLDAAAINVRRPRTARRTAKAATDGDGAEASSINFHSMLGGAGAPLSFSARRSPARFARPLRVAPYGARPRSNWPKDPVFPGKHIKMFNNLLTRSKLNARSRRPSIRARPTACAIPISACASWKARTSTRSPKTAAPASR